MKPKEKFFKAYLNGGASLADTNARILSSSI